MPKSESNEVRGELEFDRFSPTQWQVTLTNNSTNVSECIVLDDDSLETLVDILNRLRRGDFPSAMLQVNHVGAEIDHEGVRE